MAISEKSFPQNFATLAHFFHKNPLKESHWIFFCHQVAKIRPKKTPNNN
jgi:hypothetical protein